MRIKIFFIGLAVFFTTFMSQNSKPEYAFVIGGALIIFSLMSSAKK